MSDLVVSEPRVTGTTNLAMCWLSPDYKGCTVALPWFHRATLDMLTRWLLRAGLFLVAWHLVVRPSQSSVVEWQPDDPALVCSNLSNCTSLFATRIKHSRWIEPSSLQNLTQLTYFNVSGRCELVAGSQGQRTNAGNSTCELPVELPFAMHTFCPVTQRVYVRPNGLVTLNASTGYPLLDWNNNQGSMPQAALAALWDRWELTAASRVTHGVTNSTCGGGWCHCCGL